MNRKVQVNEVHRGKVNLIEYQIKKSETFTFDQIRDAFHKYANAHSAPKEMTDLEWDRFSKILRRIKR